MPTRIFYRIQPFYNEIMNETDIKIRQVWCVPQRIISLEFYFFKNILDRIYSNIKSGQTIYATGLRNSDLSINIVSMFRSQLIKGDNDLSVFSLDYSKYDRKIPGYAIDLFYLIVEQELNLDNNQKKLLSMLRFYVKHTPYCYGNSFYIQMRGIPSGCYVTNLIGSWWNLTLCIISNSIYMKDRSRYNPGKMATKEYANKWLGMNNLVDIGSNREEIISVCGDDIVIYTSNLRVLHHIKLCECFELEVEVYRRSVKPSDPIFFLGRYWDSSNRPIQSYGYIFSHIVFRTKWFSKQEVDFNSEDDLNLSILLSVCLPLHNGMDFLLDNYIEWKPFRDFLEGSSGFTYLKDYVLGDKFRKISRTEAMRWENF